MNETLTAILLGIVEGLTEFLPVSSTGHLILATELFGYDAGVWEVFNIVIQLGAILAVVAVYWRTFWAVFLGLFAREPGSWRFLANLMVATVPAAVLGLLFKDQIAALLESPLPVGWALILGGIAILVIEKRVQPGEATGIGGMPLRTAFGIGMIQCLALIPGVSRSGATIMGALALGVERRTAAEFSFFLAIPAMLGASIVQIYDHRAELAAGAGPVGWDEIGIGFVVAFLVALAVIRGFVTFVSRHGFAPFAWYRIIAGALAIAWLTLR